MLRTVTHLSKQCGYWLLGGLCTLIVSSAQAQAPAWNLALNLSSNSGLNSGNSYVNEITTDAQGNVLVTGTFRGTLTLGTTTLASAGSTDLFLAKYSPTTSTWVWAVRGGGTGNDAAGGVAVSGTSIYLTGYIQNDLANSNQVAFSNSNGSARVQLGATTTTNGIDAVLVKYTDAGSAASCTWSQVGGGTGDDAGADVAVSGSNVYVTGVFYNNLANTNSVVFGGSGSTPGTVRVNGATATVSQDLLLVKYTDNGATATLGWTQVGGGTSGDYSNSLAVSGTSIYLAGAIRNTLTDANKVVFGGDGTTAGTNSQIGAAAATSYDVLLAKYTDNGATGSFRWSQVGGGYDTDQAFDVAVSGSNVYVSGYISNSSDNANQVAFGSSGVTPPTVTQLGTAPNTTNPDFLLAKYIDNGSSAALGWLQVAGGSGDDEAAGLAVSGNTILVTGQLTNDLANSKQVVFGGSGTTPGTLRQVGATSVATQDILLARYTDNGATATVNWTQVGGGQNYDGGAHMALKGQQIYVAGYYGGSATFGTTTINTSGPSVFGGVVLRTTDTSLPLASTSPTTSPGLTLYPNPSTGIATLQGASSHVVVYVFDVLGKAVLTTLTDATGTATLPKLSPGFYLVRTGTSLIRLAVE